MSRRIGTTTLALVLGLLGMAPPAAARQPTPIQDRLITELEGFELLPHSESYGESSGPLPGAQLLAHLAGVDVGDEEVAGYGRIFTTDAHSGSTVIVVGVDITGLDADLVLDGLAPRPGDRREGPTQLFVDADPPLDGLVSYARSDPGLATQAEATSYVAGDLLVIVEVQSTVDRTAYLRRAAKAQVEVAPPTVTPGYVPVPGPPADPPETDDDGGAVAAGAPGPRSGVFDGDDDGDSWVSQLLGAVAVLATAVLVVRAGGSRKRVRAGPQP